MSKPLVVLLHGVGLDHTMWQPVVALLENGARFDDAGDVVGLDLPKTLQPFWVGGNGRDIVRWV